MNGYSEQFREAMVKKMSGAQGRSATSLAEEVGVPQSTLSRWMRQYATMARGGSMNTGRPQDWKMRERLEAIIAYEKLSEEKRGEFLRTRGLHEATLEQWKQQLVEDAEAGGKSKQRGSSPEKKRIRELEKDLRKKEKALAETAALLVLKKKVNAIWGDQKDDE